MSRSERCSLAIGDSALRRRLRLYISTPFVGVISGAAPVCDCDSVGDLAGFENAAEVSDDWRRVKIVETRGAVGATYWLSVPVLEATESAHTQFKRPPAAIAFTGQEPPLVATLLDAGTLARTATGDVERDAYDRFVYDVPRSASVLFTSTVEANGSLRTYTYEVENLGVEARTFVIPQVVTPACPSGWSGTVSPGSSVSVTLDSSSVDTHMQVAQVTLSEAAAGGTFALPADMYVPDTLLAFDADVQVTSVGVGGAGENIVSYEIDGDTATKAVLYREAADGSWDVIEEREGVFADGIIHTLEDPSPEIGGNTYRVAVGVEPNGVASDPVSD